MSIKTKKFFAVFPIFVLLCMTACGQTASSTVGETGTTSVAASAEEAASSSGRVTITFPTESVGDNMGAGWMMERVEHFNEVYGDTIDLQVEEVPNAQSLWDKIQVLMSANDLPDILMETGRNILPMVVEAGQAVDLTPYLDADPEWKAQIGKESIEYNTYDGKIYGIPLGKQVIGYYYNMELFEQVGIEPAKTWDEFFENCDKLKAAGITPLSMDTGDEGWITSLLLASMVGTSGTEGETFMNTMYPETYQVPVFIDNVAKIQKCFQEYTTPDAVGGKYENGASNFFAEETAIICNGSWMIGNFYDDRVVAEGFGDKVGVAAYPENGMFVSPRFGYFCASPTQERADAAVKFIKEMTDEIGQLRAFEMFGAMPSSDSLVIPDDVKKDQRLGSDLIELSNNASYKYKTFESTAYTSVRTALQVQYPLLANGDITPEEFALALDEAAKEAQ